MSYYFWRKEYKRDVSETWSQEKRNFRSFTKFERTIFECSVEIFLNMKNRCLAADDKLITSKSDDVDLKCVSERKQGKEGHATNWIVSSLTSILLGIRLHLKGDIQENNIIQMMTNLHPIVKPSHYSTVSFDRGCGNFSVCKIFLKWITMW